MSEQRHALARTMSTLATASRPSRRRTTPRPPFAQTAVTTTFGAAPDEITQLHHRRIISQVHSEGAPVRCDQEELGEGPGLDAIWKQDAPVAIDLATDDR
ncbi:hypothetical protein [Salinifilum ghardaiensis]